MAQFFGAELEIQHCVNGREMKQIYQKAVNDAGFRATVSEREGKERWTLKNDHCGWEMTTPALPTTWANLKAINKWLASMSHSLMVKRKIPRKEIIYSETGLHINLDANRWTDAQKENVARAFIKFEPALFRVNDKCRQETGFSQPIRYYGVYDDLKDDLRNRLDELRSYVSSDNLMGQIEKLIKKEHRGRYHRSEVFKDHYSAMNFSRRWQTIECRHGLATMVPDDLEYWIGTLVLLTRAAKTQRQLIELKESELEMWKRYNVGSLCSFFLQHRFNEHWMNQYKRKVCRWLTKKSHSYHPETAYRGEDDDD